MMNRICPSEEVLSAYLADALSAEEKERVERHLARCRICRRTLSEAYDILSKPDFREKIRDILKSLAKNLWLACSVLFFALSFVFSKYFLQLLVASLLMGGKWIIDSKSARMLIMIHEAWKHTDKDKTDKIHSRTDSEE